SLPPPSAIGDDFIELALDQIILIGDVLQLAGDELAAANVHARHVDCDLGALRYQRGQPAVPDRIGDRVAVDDRIEPLVVALVEPAGVEAVAGRAESDDP